MGSSRTAATVIVPIALLLATLFAFGAVGGVTGIAVADHSLEEPRAIASVPDESIDGEGVELTTNSSKTDETRTSIVSTDETMDANNTEVSTDAVDSVSDTADTSDESADDTTNAIDDMSDTVDDSVNGTADTVENTSDELDDIGDDIAETTNETASGTEPDSTDPIRLVSDGIERTTAGIADRLSSTVSAVPSIDISERELPVVGAIGDGPVFQTFTDGTPADRGIGQTVADTALVGMMGIVTVSAGAAAASGGVLAGGAGAAAGSAGAASGTAAGSGLSSASSGSVASWTRSLTARRYLRRLLEAIPWTLVAIFRYSRYDDSDPLENETRATIYETVRDDPGRYLSQISDETGVALSTVRHHVRILEEEGLLTTAKINGKRRYYLEEENTKLQAALEEPAKRDVLETLATIGQANNSRLAEELDRDPSTVSHHLSRLEEDGLIVRKKEGRATINELSPNVRATIEDEKPRPTMDPVGQSPADD